MRKTILSLLLMILAATTLPAVYGQAWRGNARLQGTVVDQKSGQPVNGAKVALRLKSNGGPDLTTNAQGKWSVLGLGSGSWDIDVTAPGYVTKALSLSIAEGERIPPMKIELEPAEEVAPPPPPAEAPVEEVQIGGVAVSPDVAAAVEAGNAFVAAGKFKEAVEQYEKAYPLLSSNLGLKMALARAYYGTGDLKKSVALLNEAYQIDPANVPNVLMFAQLLLEDGQLDRGREVIEKLPAGALTEPTALINIGILLMNKKQPAAAYDYFTKAIAIDANRAESYYLRGLAGVQTKQMKSARADFAKVLVLAPDSSEAKEAKELLKSIE
jgi:tetratricopeptide (TPR) repeat protein